VNYCSSLDADAATLDETASSAGHTVTVSAEREPGRPSGGVIDLVWENGPTVGQLRELIRATVGGERWIDRDRTRTPHGAEDRFLTSYGTVSVCFERTVTGYAYASTLAVRHIQHRTTNLCHLDEIVLEAATDAITRTFAVLVADRLLAGGDIGYVTLCNLRDVACRLQTTL